ncbi:topoisomerase DNA-binding C4 zinc finger domain-containing protein [Pseudomonas asturiensis]|uniref:topoisomerase DNA-binding C4 zinc finger domain-containing protein n=1 Tax=Pseudomonas asturiensis TaxID=1190415 RepID=UPI0009350B79|nr:topoisomerase DNA-binding C4 zinc finger domain-containing protein [Pseudomonas asturiensis]
MARKNPSPLPEILNVIRRLFGVLRKGMGSRHSHEHPVEPPPRPESPPTVAPVSKPPAHNTTRLRKKPHRPAISKPEPKPATPGCPHCKKPMVIKVARTGKNAGEFWGCAAYPKCRGIRPIFRKD